MIASGWGHALQRAVLGDEALDPHLLEQALDDLGAELRAPMSWPEFVYGARKSGVRRKGEIDLGWEETS